MKESKLKVRFFIVLSIVMSCLLFLSFMYAQDKGTDDSAGAEAEFVSVDDAVRADSVRAEQWDPNKAYTGGMQVEYDGIIWEAKWWTQGDVPGQSDVWKQITVIPPTPTIPPPTPNNGAVAIELRDVPDQCYPGAEVEITVDFKNTSNYEIGDAKATITLPAGASLKAYAWNQTQQPINGVGIMLANKQLPPNPPRLFVYGTDDFNNSVEDCLAHIKPMNDLNRRMSANILAGALYFDAWDPDITAFYGTSLYEFMRKNNYEIGAHTFHHSHMGVDLHMNSMWLGETTRRYKRGSTWGVPNTAQEQMMEIALGKYWNEIYFNRRMEGFRSPFLEFNIPQGQESKTKTPLRSDKWNVIGKAGLRYVCTVNEGPSGWPPQEIGHTPLASLDPRCAVPSWPPLCDEVSVAGDPRDAYTNTQHQVHNILVGTQRLVTPKIEWGTIFDDSFIGNFSYERSMNYLKRYTDRHYTVTQTEIPQPYINGQSGGLNKQSNIPISYGLHATFTNDKVPENWKAENKKGNDWVYDIDQYVTNTYPDAKNVTHKDVLDYYLGIGTIRWIVTMPQTPGNYTFSIAAPGNSSKNYSVQVKAPATLYNEVSARVAKVIDSAEVSTVAGKGYTDVMYAVKGETGSTDISGLNSVISAAAVNNMGVYAYVSVFKDTAMHTTQTLDHAGVVVSDIAEPTDTAYRNALRTLMSQLSGMSIKGIILDTSIPSDSKTGPTYGYSDAMVNHFKKYFGPPPSGTNPQDPTTESDPNYYSIYTAAATGDWRTADIPWYYYDLRTLANHYFTTNDMSNLGADSDGTLVVDWSLCTDLSGADYNGTSSWDEWEAWGEFRRYLVADFVNEVAGGATKPVYALVKGEKDASDLLENSCFGDATDPIEFADITRRPNMLPDKWNQAKSDNIAGVIYYIDGVEPGYIRECVEMGRRIDYWVAKGGNTNRGMMPQNEYRPLNDTKIYGSCVDTSKSNPGQAFEDARAAGASTVGNAPGIVIVTKHLGGGNPVLKNVALNKPIYSSGDYAPAFGKQNANDGNDATVWGSKLASTGNQWIFIDLGKQYAIEGLVAKWFDKYYASTYSVGISNDMSNWTLIKTINKTSPGADTITEKRTARYIGFLCTKANDIAYGLAELEIYSYQN